MLNQFLENYAPENELTSEICLNRLEGLIERLFAQSKLNLLGLYFDDYEYINKMILYWNQKRNFEMRNVADLYGVKQFTGLFIVYILIIIKFNKELYLKKLEFYVLSKHDKMRTICT